MADIKAKGKAKETAPDDILIAVTKAGEIIRVHPLSLDNHIEIGWTVTGR